MADIRPYFRKLLPWEGGYVNDPVDAGGATNMGVTLATWRMMGYDKDGDGDIDSDDIRLLTPDDAMMVCKKGYWDKWQADKILNQSVAEQLVDWLWGSGYWGIKIPQRILGLKEDGRVGPVTLAAVNNADQEDFFNKVKQARIDFINAIFRRDPRQLKFKRGWMGRVNAFIFIP
jgi:lysozyme family protein